MTTKKKKTREKTEAFPVIVPDVDRVHNGTDRNAAAARVLIADWLYRFSNEKDIDDAVAHLAIDELFEIDGEGNIKVTDFGEDRLTQICDHDGRTS